MNFKTVSIVKHPIHRVWLAMRDELPNVANHLEDIREIKVESHLENCGVHRVVNIWQAAPKLPEGIKKRLEPEMFAWTDRAEWNEQSRQCRWEIEPHYWKDRIECKGTTTFREAMGGQGTRITFDGTIQWKSHNSSIVTSFLGETAIKGLESIIMNQIPKNFRKITDALSTYLSSNEPQ